MTAIRRHAAHDKIALVAKILTDAGVEIDAEQTKTLVGCIAFDDISGALEVLREIGIAGAMFEELKIIIEEMRKGVPLGYFTSQWFGNFYLKALDHYGYYNDCNGVKWLYVVYKNIVGYASSKYLSK